MARETYIPDTAMDYNLRAESQPLAPEARPEQFGAQVGEQMQRLGDSIAQGGATVEDAVMFQKHLDTQQWVSQSMTQEKNYIDKWMADPNNYSDPNFSNNLQKLFQSRHDEYANAAPSIMARHQFQSEFNEFQQDRMGTSFRTQAEQTLIRGQQQFINQFSTMLDTYRTNLNNPGVNASNELIKDFTAMHQRINAMYGKIAPTMAHDLREELTSQAAYGVVNTDPQLAQHLLDNGVLEGRTRHFIQDEIDRSLDAHGAVNREKLDANIQNHLAMVEAGRTQDKLPLEYYLNYLPRDQAQAYMSKVNARIDIYNDANQEVNRLSPLCPNCQEEELSKLQSGIGANEERAGHDMEVYDAVEKRVAQNLREMNNDPTSYLTANNPILKSLAQHVRDDKSGNPQLMQEFGDALLRYQGPPPANVGPGDNKDFYLNLPLSNVRLIDKGQAQDIVKNIIGAAPRKAVQTLDRTLQQYSPNTRMIAFNDLVREKLPGEMVLAENHLSAPWRDDFVGSIMNAKEIHRDLASKEQDFTKALDSDPMWLTYQRAYSGDNFQSQSMIDQMHSGIMTYAMALSQKENLKPDAAVRLATDRLTDEGHVKAEVNGKMVMLNKDVVGDQDGSDLSRRLSNLLTTVDPRQLAQTSRGGSPLFPFTQTMGRDIDKYKAIYDLVQQRGEFNVNPDGKSFSLYMNGGEVLDNNSHPITVQLSDLPEFTHKLGKTSMVIKDKLEPMKSFIKSNFIKRGIPPVLTTNWPNMYWHSGKVPGSSLNVEGLVPGPLNDAQLSMTPPDTE